MTIEKETETETSEGERPESMGDTLRAVYDELESGDTETDAEVQGDQGAESQKPVGDVSQAARTLAQHRGKRGKKAAATGEQTDIPAAVASPDEAEAQGEPVAAPDVPPGATPRKLDPPQSWPVPDKEAFNQLPDVAKTKVLDFWGNIEEKFTKGSQELARHRQRYQQLDELMDFYRPRWNSQGLTDGQVTAELFAAHDILTRDPLEGANRLLANLGITPEQIHAYRQQSGQGGAPANTEQVNPQYNQLTQRVDEVYNWLQQSRQSHEQQHLQNGVQQIDAVRNERSSDGRYTYPELWNDAYLIERVQPLVTNLLKSNPSVPLSEAVKRTVHTLRLLDGHTNGTPSQQGSGLSREEIAKVKAASASVRGRGNAAIPTAGAAQPGEKVRDSLEAVWQQLSNSH